MPGAPLLSRMTSRSPTARRRRAGGAPARGGGDVGVKETVAAEGVQEVRVAARRDRKRTRRCTRKGGADVLREALEQALGGASGAPPGKPAREAARAGTDLSTPAGVALPNRLAEGL